MMARTTLNVEELVPWCERRGLDAREIVAEEPTWRKAGDGIHYLLRRRAPGVDDPAQWPIVEVVAPFDDPMPRVYRHDEPLTGSIVDDPDFPYRIVCDHCGATVGRGRIAGWRDGLYCYEWRHDNPEHACLAIE